MKIWMKPVLTVFLAMAVLANPMTASKAQAECAFGKGAGYGTLAGAVVGGITGFFVFRNAVDNATDAAGADGDGADTASNIGGGVGAVLGFFGGAVVGLVIGLIVGGVMCAVDGGSDATYVDLGNGEVMAASKRAIQSVQQDALLMQVDNTLAGAADAYKLGSVSVMKTAFDDQTLAHAAKISLNDVQLDFGGELALPAFQ